MITKVSVLPKLRNGSLLPRTCCIARSIRGSLDVTTTPSCIPPLGPPPGGTKFWKFSPGDIRERELWDAYTEAYEEALARTSAPTAPWYFVPADKKWLRDLLVAQVVAETLERLDPKYPGPPPGLEEFRRALR